MEKRWIILIFSIAFCNRALAQNILVFPLDSKKTEKDTTSPHGDIFAIRPFSYRINPISLPDSLERNKYSAIVYVEAWVDSNAKLLSMAPKDITLFQKGSENPKKIKKIFEDSNWGTVKWENITPEAKRYIDWILQVLPQNITFKRRKDPPPAGVKYLPPVKAKNYVPITVHVR